MLFFITLTSFFWVRSNKWGSRALGHLSIHHYPEDSSFLNTVVTVGTFDGVHLGHQSILERLKAHALATGRETVLATFEPHPRIALGKDTGNLKLLNTPDEKRELISNAGIDHMVIFPFTPGFSRQDEHTFIRKYLVDYLHVETLVIGYNHRFGHRRYGSFASLQDYGNNYGFQVEEIPRKDVGEAGVSSTQIRNMLQKGDIAAANAMLGYDYPLAGEVVTGKKIGRSLGYPTANLSVKDPFKLIPAFGAYAVLAEVEGTLYPGMCNIGIKPTFSETVETIEVHILGFEGDLYNKKLRIRFVDRLRDEIKFDSREALMQQMADDRSQTLQLLKKLKNIG